MAEDIKVYLDTGNAAFDCEPGSEVARILRDLADKFERGTVAPDFRLYDFNGNPVGGGTIRRARRKRGE